MPATSPDQLHEHFVTKVHERDLDALMDLYEQNCLVVQLDGHHLHGASAIRLFLADFLERLQELESTPHKVWVNGDVALVSATWHAVLVDPGGGTTSARGTAAHVARRQPDGTWRYAIDDPALLDAPA